MLFFVDILFFGSFHTFLLVAIHNFCRKIDILFFVSFLYFGRSFFFIDFSWSLRFIVLRLRLWILYFVVELIEIYILDVHLWQFAEIRKLVSWLLENNYFTFSVLLICFIAIFGFSVIDLVRFWLVALFFYIRIEARLSY